MGQREIKAEGRRSWRERLAGLWSRHGAGIFLAGGAAGVSAGIGMIYLPAGVIAAGGLLLLAGVLSILGGERP